MDTLRFVVLAYVLGMFIIGFPMARYTFRAWKESQKYPIAVWLLLSSRKGASDHIMFERYPSVPILRQVLRKPCFYKELHDDYVSILTLQCLIVIMWPLVVLYHVARIGLWLIVVISGKTVWYESPQRSSRFNLVHLL